MSATIKQTCNDLCKTLGCSSKIRVFDLKFSFESGGNSKFPVHSTVAPDFLFMHIPPLILSNTRSVSGWTEQGSVKKIQLSRVQSDWTTGQLFGEQAGAEYPEHPEREHGK